MKLFLSYLKYHFKSLLMFFAMAIIFISVFILYDVSPAPVIYAFVLFTFLAVIALSVDFYFFRKKHNNLLYLLKTINVNTDNYIEPSNIIEKDFINIISEIDKNKTEIYNDKENRLTEINDFYTLWIHQIKTPISALYLLLESPDYNKEEIREQIFKIEQYAEMVLTYLRVDSSSTDYVFKKYNIDTIIKTSIKKFSKTFIRKKIKLIYTPSELEIFTDNKWFGFVIEQILSNSLKYTNKGSVTIFVKDNNLVISDTGIGIAPEDLPRVFDKGYTGYNGRENKKSTGIGLYLCRKIINNLSENIRIDSEIGIGTTVFITLNTSDYKYE